MPDSPPPGGVTLDVSNGLAVITIDRPAARNAIGSATTAELDAALAELEQRDDVAVLVITGGGDRAFVSGGDLKELSAVRTHADAMTMALRVRGVLDRIADFPAPVIAALNGHAVGGGAEVALAADIRIAADDIRIGFNQVTLGIMPAWGGAERLAQAVGRSRALLAIGTGEQYDAATARDLGLVDIVVPRSEFHERWRALAHQLAGQAPGATRAIKSVVAPAAPALHRQFAAAASDAFATLWAADAHWAAVDNMSKGKT